MLLLLVIFCALFEHFSYFAGISCEFNPEYEIKTYLEKNIALTLFKRYANLKQSCGTRCLDRLSSL